MNHRNLRPFILLGLTFLCASPLLAQAPALVINDATVPIETNGGVGDVAFTVSFVDSTPHGNVTIFYSTSGGNATPGSSCNTGVDYLSANNVGLSFNSTENVKTIRISVCGDPRDEPDETFFVNLSGATGGATIQDAQGVATLIDDDPSPSLRINDVTVTEGNAGTTNAVFTITASAASENAVSVSYSTANQTATGGSCGSTGADYATTSSSVALASGQPTQTLTIPICGDVLGEPNEQFEVRLSNATNATLQDATGRATLTNDDPMISITPTVAVTEGDGGTTNAVFTVSVQGSNGNPVGVSYATAAGTATGGTCGTSGADFGSTSGTLTFTAGQPSQTLSVPVCGEIHFEPNEQFEMRLSSPTNGTIQSAVSVATITNNDPIIQDHGITGPARPILTSIAPTIGIAPTVTVTEPTSLALIRNAVFPVTVSGAVTDPVTVSFATSPGTATAGACNVSRGRGDYVSKSGTLTFNSASTQNITVRICGDGAEPPETFTVTLSNAANASITQATGTATIE